MKKVLLLLALGVVVVLGLDQAGVIALPGIPKFFLKDKAPEVVDLDEEETVEEPDLAQPADTGTPTKRAAPTRAAANGPTAEELRQKEQRARVQKQVDIVAELDAKTAAETLTLMAEPEQLAILRMLDEDDAAKILEELTAEERAPILSALGQAAASP